MKKPFAILHELEDTQFLVDTAYDHGTDEFSLTYKFWSVKINGYISATMYWTGKQVKDQQRTFKKFIKKEYCQTFKEGTEAKFFGV